MNSENIKREVGILDMIGFITYGLELGVSCILLLISSIGLNGDSIDNNFIKSAMLLLGLFVAAIVLGSPILLILNKLKIVVLTKSVKVFTLVCLVFDILSVITLLIV